MAYLFDTDAISELLKKTPLVAYANWVAGLRPEDQFTSSVVIAELFAGACLLAADGRTEAAERHLWNLRERVIPAVTILPFDTLVAETYGRIRSVLQSQGTPLADMDMQIAATAKAHNLILVTGNVVHFERIPGLNICRVLSDARAGLRPPPSDI
jgi:predicted nucleic acid-binding protein